jgi:hypothetical protein
MKSMYIKRKIAPSFQLMVSLDKKYQKNRFVRMENITKFWNTSMFKVMDVPISVGTKNVIPKIKVILKKLAPIRLPNARPEWPLKIDFSPMVISGKLVPKAIIVAPITVCEIPTDSAIPMAEFTRKFALTTMPSAPAMV